MDNFDLRKFLTENKEQVNENAAPLFARGGDIQDFLEANFAEYKNNDVSYDEDYLFEIPVEVFVKAINDGLRDNYEGSLGFENGKINFIGGA